MKQANRQDVQNQILSCLGDQQNYVPKNVYIRLKLKVGTPNFEAKDCGRFREELYRLVAITDHGWPSNEDRNGPQGYLCKDLDDYPTLRKYLSEVHFESTQGPSPFVKDWIEFKPYGQAFSPGGRLNGS